MVREARVGRRHRHATRFGSLGTLLAGDRGKRHLLDGVRVLWVWVMVMVVVVVVVVVVMHRWTRLLMLLLLHVGTSARRHGWVAGR